MKVNGDLLFYWIRKTYPSAFCSANINIEVDRPIFPDKKSKMQKHLVVIEHSKGLRSVSLPLDSIGLMIGYSHDELSNIAFEYIAIPENKEIGDVFNNVFEIFEMFQKLYDDLDDAVNRFFSYEAILHSCDSLVDVPFMIRDTNYRYVSYSRRLAYENGFEDKYVRDDNYMSLEAIGQLATMTEDASVHGVRDVYHYVCIENMMYKNIYDDGELVGTMGLPWSRDEATNRYRTQLLELLSGYVEKLYERFGTFWRSENSHTSLKAAISMVLEGRSVDREMLTNLLNSNQFSTDDKYSLIQFVSAYADMGLDASEALAARIESLWPGSCCIRYGNSFLCLINLTVFERATHGKLRYGFAYFIRDGMLRAGISREFSDLFMLQSAYRQTEIALKIGSRIDTMYWYYLFDNYAYQHLLEHGRDGFSPKQICHTAILQLLEYDDANGTQLNHTLKTFIEMQYNAAATAKELFIARSSFLKRMDRIEEITGINLDNYQERLYLAMSYEINENTNSSGKQVHGSQNSKPAGTTDTVDADAKS